MPSSEDCYAAEAEAINLAVKAIMLREKCSEAFAKEYVSRLSQHEIATLIGWPPPGQPYSAW